MLRLEQSGKGLNILIKFSQMKPKKRAFHLSILWRGFLLNILEVAIVSAHNEKSCPISASHTSHLPTTATIATPPLVSTWTKRSYRAMNHGQVSELNESSLPKSWKILENDI